MVCVMCSLCRLIISISLLICCICTAPTASPSNISLGMVESTSISISWQPPSLEHQNGIIRKYILAVTEIETSKKFNLTVASYNTSTTIYSLHPYYTYQIYVFASTVATSPPSQLTTVQTAQDSKLCSYLN